MPNAVSVATAKLIRVIATGLGMNIKPADAVKGCRSPTLPRSAKTTTHPLRPLRIPGGQCTKASISAKVTSA
ncbi:hypothetical protein ABIF38_004016 [Bradyrhizobium japonicum]|jgi:hypothetical protein|uniref:Uncharacterized protein n=1 Tax=Bradyrhizobium elkanii TaxID=29448 RepID=A0ABV4FA40_BRAEL|nr:hypothetical protein [Bradyrhizobium elkanii]MCP1733666.1 hypothetical protein [Bradyrhizobium elkanii]MCP1751343.1 hypothetical protein [Bradyrhizobium elkanii]MCS3569003.1 hypothetical protein [Bradyrhizobium elkanii]MCS3589513.1 hypothetical protein [Bradyrhizobium elkanii]